MRSLLVIFLTILALGSRAQSTANADDVLLLDLSDRWLRYDESLLSYVPYLKGVDPTQQNLHCWVDVTEMKEAVLVFQAEPGLMLFTEDRLVYRNNTLSVQAVRIPVNQWTVHGREVKLSIYHSQGRLWEASYFLGKKPEVVRVVKSWFNYLPRVVFSLQSQLLLHLLLVIGLFALLRNNFPKLQHDLVLIQSPLRSANISEAANYSPFGSPLVVAAAAISTALVQCYFYSVDATEFGQRLFGNSVGSFGLLSMLVLDVLLIAAFLLLKYSSIFVISKLFNAVAEPRIHYFELIRVLFKFTLLVLSISTLLYFSGWLPNFVNAHFFFISMILAGIWLSIRLIFTLGKEAAFQNIYLFSYICASEILPLVLMAKLLL